MKINKEKGFIRNFYKSEESLHTKIYANKAICIQIKKTCYIFLILNKEDIKEEDLINKNIEFDKETNFETKKREAKFWVDDILLDCIFIVSFESELFSITTEDVQEIKNKYDELLKKQNSGKKHER
jgi:predicted metal-binding transcription factor (methanogenesis marker protein 9)